MPPIFVTPTRDIHLLLGGEPMLLRARMRGDDITRDAGTSWIGNYASVDLDPAIVEVDFPGSDTHARLTPKGVGRTFGVIRHDGPGGVRSEGVIRVWVHEAVADFWIANDRITIHKDEVNYNLTLQARFTDGSIGDVTDTPDFELTPGDLTMITVETFPYQQRGRISAVKVGTTEVIVTYNGTTKSVPVVVLDQVDATTRPILKRIHGIGRRYRDHRNILFLPEGYGPSDEASFLAAAEDIKDRLLTSPAHRPFDLLSDQFIVWVAWQPPHSESSDARGITVGPLLAKRDVDSAVPIPPPDRPKDGSYSVRELVEMVGPPDAGSPTTVDEAEDRWSGVYGFEPARLDQDLIDLWRQLLQPAFLPPKNTFFGLAMGARPGHPRTWPIADPAHPNPNIWYRQSLAHRHLGYDPRRQFGPSGRIFVDKYLRTLRPEKSTDADFAEPVGDTWSLAGRDVQLVCFLVNEEHYGATFHGLSNLVTMGDGSQYSVSGSPPVLTSQTPVSVPDVEQAAATLAHELGHAFRLADEYEGYDFPRDERRAGAEAADDLKHSLNVDTHEDVRSSTNPTDVNPALIRWDVERILLGSRVRGQAIRQTGGDVLVEIRVREGRRWYKTNDDEVDVFIRTPKFATHGPLRIQAIGIWAPSAADPALLVDYLRLNQAPDMTPAERNDFYEAVDEGQLTDGSVVFVPKRDRNKNILKLIHPKVMEHLKNTKAPFSPRTKCREYDEDPEYPPKISGFRAPGVRYRTIGLYEGAATYNCHAYRPAGMCAMRKDYHVARQVWEPFCFVCQYMIGNDVDPGVLAKLDKDYPEGC